MRCRTLTTVLLAGCVTACGTASNSTVDTDPAAPSTSSTSARDVTAAADEVEPLEVTDRPSTTSQAVSPVSTTPPTTGASVAPCDEDVILGVVADALSDPPRIVVVEVSIPECANGYARVWAVPDNSMCDPGSSDSECFAEEQVFLIDRSGTWEVLAQGTGIECWDEHMRDPEVVAACTALGWPAAGETEPPPTGQPTAEPTLEQVLDPYEMAAASGHGLRSFSVDDCYRGGWGSDSADTSQPATHGDVVLCGGQSEPPAELGSLLVVVVDDAGTTASLWDTFESGERLALWTSEEQSLPFDAMAGQLCREFLAHPRLDGWLTDPVDTELGSARNAYVLVLAYWFLEGQPTRMDVDDNGIPCETLFPPDVVADVWAGDF